MSRREDMVLKSPRYLAEGRLGNDLVDDDQVHAQVRGDGEQYETGWDRERGWWCTCAARRSCCHRLALRCVTVRRSP